MDFFILGVCFIVFLVPQQAKWGAGIVRVVHEAGIFTKYQHTERFIKICSWILIFVSVFRFSNLFS